jgi:Domain of unknown function (DUF3303)
MVFKAYLPKGSCRQVSSDGGAPPAGVKILGRWHGSAAGFVLAETNDLKALYEWIVRWSDSLEFAVTLVMDDAEAAEVMKNTSG